MANALTACRLLLLLPFFTLMATSERSSAPLAAAVIVIAIVTDLLDGPVARVRRTESSRGRTFDHTADFLFVCGGLAAGASRGVFPWVLPALVAVAFVQYVLDSFWIHRRGGLLMSQLGRWNGILYFAPLCGDVLIRLGLDFLQPLLWLLVWTLVASTLVSIVLRLTLVSEVVGGPRAG